MLSIISPDFVCYTGVFFLVSKYCCNLCTLSLYDVCAKIDTCRSKGGGEVKWLPITSMSSYGYTLKEDILMFSEHF